VSATRETQEIPTVLDRLLELEKRVDSAERRQANFENWLEGLYAAVGTAYPGNEPREKSV